MSLYAVIQHEFIQPNQLSDLWRFITTNCFVRSYYYPISQLISEHDTYHFGPDSYSSVVMMYVITEIRLRLQLCSGLAIPNSIQLVNSVHYLYSSWLGLTP